jgi:FkbM family methyltransferase
MKWLAQWLTRLRCQRALLFTGRALYFGQTVYFPLKSHIFARLANDGAYEPDVVELLLDLVLPGTTYIDVGANIGLLSLPVLARIPDAFVLSIEASPDTMQYLERTHRTAGLATWTLVSAAVGDRVGEMDFFSGEAAEGAFDGLRDTGRGGGKRATKLVMRTLDDIWREAGEPVVSVIKIDIEGAETLAIRGAGALIANCRPALVIEWSGKNLPAYGIAPESLFELCERIGYVAHAFPSLVRIDNLPILRLSMSATETFLLIPRQDSTQ